MPNKKSEILKISRLLTPKRRADLLAWVRLAYTAESSVRKSMGFDVVADGVSSLRPQEYSCENSQKRSEK
ncbi:MAG: hypothetical protein LBQ82_05890 [Treponema sp.]|jgi:hypothetical protein|nr:hypothetical protein [Treponema sp.]